MKNIIITGAAQGIGYFLVKQLLAENYNVAVFDINIDPLIDIARQYSSLLPITCDVRSYDQVKSAVQKSVDAFGSVDCAIHNACRCTFDPMEMTADDVYKDVFDVNYFGALHLSRAVIPFMRAQKSGKVIFTSSGVGIMGFINISPYASSKGAIESLAKCLNNEYRNEGIRFHLFHPPLTRTKSAEPLPVPKEFMADPERVGTGLAKNIRRKSFVICHSFGQRLQTKICYLVPVIMGQLMSKMTEGYAGSEPPAQQSQ
ncbi:MAG: short-chain dehydrogenase [Clostridiales bacterium]|nr:short-chain dehydrogenase [Clostridiales bacterium]